MKCNVGTVCIDAEVPSTDGVTLPFPLETYYEVSGLQTRMKLIEILEELNESLASLGGHERWKSEVCILEHLKL